MWPPEQPAESSPKQNEFAVYLSNTNMNVHKWLPRCKFLLREKLLCAAIYIISQNTLMIRTISQSLFLSFLFFSYTQKLTTGCTASMKDIGAINFPVLTQTSLRSITIVKSAFLILHTLSNLFYFSHIQRMLRCICWQCYLKKQWRDENSKSWNEKWQQLKVYWFMTVACLKRFCTKNKPERSSQRQTESRLACSDREGGWGCLVKAFRLVDWMFQYKYKK